MSESDAPPGPGESRTTHLPATEDALEYTLQRIVRLIQEGRKDPVVIETAREIAQLSAQISRQLGRPVTDENRNLIQLEGIHAWCRERFEYVQDPTGIELIQTPQKMLRGLKVSPEALESYWKPIRKAMEVTLPSKQGAAVVASTVPGPKMVGDADEAVIIALTLAAAIGIQPLRMRLGGKDNTFHYVWGSAWAMDEWHDFDILYPEFGKHPNFKIYREIEVPVDGCTE